MKRRKRNGGADASFGGRIVVTGDLLLGTYAGTYPACILDGANVAGATASYVARYWNAKI